MQKESKGRLLLSFFDIVNLDTVGVDACIAGLRSNKSPSGAFDTRASWLCQLSELVVRRQADPRADASIRPYNYAKFVGVGVPGDPQRMFLIEKERYYA